MIVEGQTANSRFSTKLPPLPRSGLLEIINNCEPVADPVMYPHGTATIQATAGKTVFAQYTSWQISIRVQRLRIQSSFAIKQTRS